MQPQINTDERSVAINKITETIIAAAYQVSNTLGVGFLEKVYENALCHEIRQRQLPVEQQKPINVYYQGITVGEYVADLIVDNRVLVELKAVKQFDDIHMAQCINYLKATKMNVCLLLNFGTSKLGIKRLVHNLKTN